MLLGARLLLLLLLLLVLQPLLYDPAASYICKLSI
jgi:hypothetical protein